MARQKFFEIMVFLFISAGFVLLCLMNIHLTQDDAYISLRYAQNLAGGIGLKFNKSDPVPVEGYTNFLWTIILTIPFFIKMNPVWFMKLLGISSGLSLLWIWRSSCIRFGVNSILTITGLLLITMNFSVIIWTVSGMETILFSTLCLGTFSAFAVHCKSSIDWFRMGVWLFLAILCRPEGMLLTAVIIAAIVHKTLKDRFLDRSRFFRFIGVFFLLTMSYLLWKYYYFGSIIPNTFYAKVGLHGWERTMNGLSYFKGWMFVWGGPLLFIILLGLPHLVKSIEKLWLLAFILSYSAYVILVGGDFMRHYRFWAPLIGPLCMASILSIQSLFVESGDRRRASFLVKKCAVALLLILYALPNVVANADSMKLLIAKAVITDGNHRDAVLGRWMKKTFPPSVKIAIYNIGRIPFYSELETIDTLGLTDPAIAKHIRKWDICKLAQEVLQKAPDVIIPQELMIIQNVPEQSWRKYMMEWKGARPMADLIRLFDPDAFYQNSATGCPEIILVLKNDYIKFVQMVEGNRFILYISKKSQNGQSLLSSLKNAD